MDAYYALWKFCDRPLWLCTTSKEEIQELILDYLNLRSAIEPTQRQIQFPLDISSDKSRGRWAEETGRIYNGIMSLNCEHSQYLFLAETAIIPFLTTPLIAVESSGFQVDRVRSLANKHRDLCSVAQPSVFDQPWTGEWAQAIEQSIEPIPWNEQSFHQQPRAVRAWIRTVLLILTRHPLPMNCRATVIQYLCAAPLHPILFINGTV